MSDSSPMRSWIVALAALGGLGAGIWYLGSDGGASRSDLERTVGPPVVPRDESPEIGPAELIPAEVAGPASLEDAPGPAPGEHADWTPMRLVGRVQQAGNDRPLADVLIRVEGSLGETVAGARSDEQGQFEILGRGPAELTVRPLPRRGFVLRQKPHEVSAEERHGEEEIVLVLTRGTSSPVTGVVVNKYTEEGVFELRVDVSMGELTESVRTDGNGLFQTEISFPPGMVHASVFDEPPGGPALVDAFRREHLQDDRIGPPWEMRVDIGPSFLLDSTSGGSIEPGFVARLIESDPEPPFAAVLRTGGNGLSLAEAALGELVRQRDARLRGGRAGQAEAAPVVPPTWPDVPVRPGPTPWVRYARQIVPPPPEETRRELELQVRGATWIGAAEVSTSVGHYPYTVGIPLRACGSVSGVVLDTTGAPVPEAAVRLFTRGGAEELAVPEVRTGDDGAFRLVDVEVGLHHLVIQPRIHAGKDLELRVEPGGNALTPILLPPALAAGDVSGELFVAADTPHEQPFLTLASAEGSSWREVTVARVVARDEHGTRYAFRFSDVPSGEFDLSVGHLAVEGLGRDRGQSSFWSPRKVSVYPPRDGIRFTCKAPDEPEALAFLVTNGDGEPIRHASVRFGPEGFLVGEYRLRGAKPLFVPRGVPLQWTVTASGYRPAQGSAADAVQVDDVQLVNVVMRQGWGATLHLRSLPLDPKLMHRVLAASYGDKSALAKTPGLPVQARIFADGIFVGKTDREGRIDLSLPRRPELLGVVHPGWRGYRVVDQGRAGAHTEALLFLVDLRELEESYGK